MSGRTKAVAFLSAVAVVACVGCSGSSASTSSRQSVVAAADATSGERTARTSSVFTTESRGEPVTIRMESSFDFRSGDSRTTMHGLAGLTASEIRVVEGKTYMKGGLVPEDQAQLSAKPWVRLGGDDPDAAMFSRPSAVLDAMRAVTDAEPLGTERVRGVPTTRYRLTLNPAKEHAMARQIPTDKLRELHPTIEAWVDHAGRLRQLTLRGRAHDAKVSSVEQFYDFGAPVDITAPPADEIFDLESSVPGDPTGAEPGR
jgi:hypothetical protein